MLHQLSTDCYFFLHSMVSLMDDQKDPKFRPTRANMLQSFQWLVTGNRPGDSLFLLYSGHGSTDQLADSDRLSGDDDVICPMDYETNDTISSEVLHKALVSPLMPGVKLTVLFDCCHSGKQTAFNSELAKSNFLFRKFSSFTYFAFELFRFGFRITLHIQSRCSRKS